MSLPLEMIPNHIKQFNLALQELCSRFDITEIVIMAEYSSNYTFVLQGSDTNYSNQSFNSIEIAIRAILEDINNKIKPENNG